MPRKPVKRKSFHLVTRREDHTDMEESHRDFPVILYKTAAAAEKHAKLANRVSKANDKAAMKRLDPNWTDRSKYNNASEYFVWSVELGTAVPKDKP